MVGSSFPVLNPDFARRLRGLSREDRVLQLQREHDMMNAVISGVAMIHQSGNPARDQEFQLQRQQDMMNAMISGIGMIHFGLDETTFDRARGGAFTQLERLALEYLFGQIHQSVHEHPRVPFDNEAVLEGIQQILQPEDGPEDGSED